MNVSATKASIHSIPFQYMINIYPLFLAVPWGCLRFVIVVFPDHTHLLFMVKRLIATVSTYQSFHKKEGKIVVHILHEKQTCFGKVKYIRMATLMSYSDVNNCLLAMTRFATKAIMHSMP